MPVFLFLTRKVKMCDFSKWLIKLSDAQNTFLCFRLSRFVLQQIQNMVVEIF